jgi:hypothetical protein
MDLKSEEVLGILDEALGYCVNDKQIGEIESGFVARSFMKCYAAFARRQKKEAGNEAS